MHVTQVSSIVRHLNGRGAQGEYVGRMEPVFLPFVLLRGRRAHQTSARIEASVRGEDVSRCDLFAGNESLYGAPHVIKHYRLYARTLCTGLHLAKEKTWLPGRMTP